MLLRWEIDKSNISLWGQNCKLNPSLLVSTLSPRTGLICLISPPSSPVSLIHSLSPNSPSCSPSACLQQLALVCLSFYVTDDVIKQDEAIGWLWHLLPPRGDRRETKRHKEIDRGKIRNVCEREPVRGSRMRVSSHIYMDTIVWNKKGIMGAKLWHVITMGEWACWSEEAAERTWNMNQYIFVGSANDLQWR